MANTFLNGRPHQLARSRYGLFGDQKFSRIKPGFYTEQFNSFTMRYIGLQVHCPAKMRFNSINLILYYKKNE